MHPCTASTATCSSRPSSSRGPDTGRGSSDARSSDPPAGVVRQISVRGRIALEGLCVLRMAYWSPEASNPPLANKPHRRSAGDGYASHDE